MKKIDQTKITEAIKKELKKEIFQELFKDISIPEGCRLDKEGKFRFKTTTVVEKRLEQIIDQLLSLLTDAKAELWLIEKRRKK